jgi:hypothetical protein
MSAKQTSTMYDLLFASFLAFASLVSSCGAAPGSKREAAISKLNVVVQKANETSRLGEPWRATPDKVPKSVLQQMNDNYEALIRDSNDIDCDVLNSVYPNLGTMFREKLIKSMSLSVEVWMGMLRGESHQITTPELQELQQKTNDSRRLELEWGEWFNGHFDDINKALSR